MIQVNEFINKVDITDSDNVNCEFEVRKKAMDFYKKYPFYEEDDWKIIKFQNSVNQYNNLKDTQKYNEIEAYKEKSKSGYKGAHLLGNKSKGIALTADILTSITVPYKKITNVEPNLKGGKEIKDGILKGDLEIPNGLEPYFKAFAIVYYWCGNMMPVVESFPPGSHGADNWLLKMDTIMDCHKAGSHQNWRDWIKESWGEDLNKFIMDYYFEDCFDKDRLIIKNIVPSFKEDYVFSLSGRYLGRLQKNNNKLAKEFLINHVKVIIQRSYRIENKFHGDWKKKEEDEVKGIFKEIFAQAGFNGGQINKMVSLF
ncbi:hypothetical protein HMPREF9184_01294 [Streptococcus sp. oral taxon 058 str. F0407]|uniref:hypothetical protein n=1 Tax=Streptococcus sp. oral taxon 058 TaxID=712622 RepID=UPI000234AB7F|nr:hypothetical protein [Streptococcus sp. oral taxon 058]EHI76649.1 hypothetical protein HMPREF9184_01294 [Streptococcus sp. oral taxon 058 str. F0407]